MQQQVIAEAVRVQQIEREQQIKVQEAEILRREKELIATVLKQAEVERQRISVLAEAEKSRLSIEAEGAAPRRPALQGEAEADIIFKKGDAEARAMNVKAEAFQEYNQAAVIDKLLTRCRRSSPRWPAPLEQGGQDHHRVHRQRRLDRHAQADRRHDRDRGAGAGAVRGAVGHADGGPAVEGAQDRRQAAGPRACDRSRRSAPRVCARDVSSASART